MADDFLTTYAPLANDISGQTGLNPATVLGIIDTETGHGQHVLGNNIFGISPGGRVAQYPDVQTASQAFVGLMRQPNYARAATVTDPAAQAQLLVRGGYNTVNPKYASAVASNAQNAVKQLGYQDGTGGDQTAQASAPDYNNTPASAPAPAAPAQPQQGSAKDRVLADPALSAGGGSSVAPASAKDRVLADPALQTTATGTTKTTAVAPSLPPVSEYGDVGPDAWFNKSATPPPAASVLPTRQSIINALQPDPNMIYGSPLDQSLPMGGNPLGAMLSPFARDPKTGDTHITLPPAIRSILLGLAGGVGPEAMTYDPKTGTLNLTPEAQAAASLGATGLRFSGENPLQFVPPGTAERPPIPAEAAANMLNPDAAARIRAAQGGPVPVEPPTVPDAASSPVSGPNRQYVDPTKPFTYNPPSDGWPAGTESWAAPPGPTSLPTGVPVTPPAEPPPVTGGGVGTAAPGISPEDSVWLKSLPSQVQELVEENAKVGGPTSLGAAATPPSAGTLTQSATRAYRTMAELNEILSPIEGPDYSVYTPGVQHTLAEREGDPIISQQERVLRERDPGKFDPVTIPDNKQLVNTFDQHAGTSVAIDNLQEKMRQIDDVNAGKVLDAATGKTADLGTAAKSLDDILNDPRHSEVDAVRKVLGPLRDAMNDADGNLKTDPRAVWGMWTNVKNAIERSKTDTGNERFVQGELLNLKGQLGDELNQTSSGTFQQLNEQHAELAKQISAMQILQKKQGTLTNRTTGMINGDSFHRWLIDLAQRRGRPGIDPSMDLPDSTMRAMINIDNDLKLNSRVDLGKARGSPTNMMFEVARAMGLAGVHGVTAAMTGGPGMANVAIQQGLGFLGNRIGNIRLNQLVRRQLPPPGGWPNLLQPPPP